MSYKDAIQEFADEIAFGKYGKDFYDLTEKQRDEVYEQAMEQYTDNLASQVDAMIDREKYSGR